MIATYFLRECPGICAIYVPLHVGREKLSNISSVTFMSSDTQQDWDRSLAEEVFDLDDCDEVIISGLNIIQDDIEDWWIVK